MKVETRIQINRPLEKVFTFLTDTDYQHLYDRSLIRVRREPVGPMRQGTIINESRNVMGKSITTCCKVIEYKPCSRYIGRSPTGLNKGTRLFQANKEGTHVTYRLEFEQQGLTAILAPLFRRVLKRELDQDMTQAKRLLESDALAPVFNQEKQP